MRAVPDQFPVTEGHTLILPRRHTDDGLKLTDAERQHANALIRLLSNRLRHEDPTIEGFNVGENLGEVAGQTIAHAHIHLIPRRRGDTLDPTGGVRGVIPGQAPYA